jgi:hypothetical protein
MGPFIKAPTNEKVHFYGDRDHMLCGIPINPASSIPATRSFEEVTCVNCRGYMVAIAKTVYNSMDLEPFLHVMED